ncbi:MAG: tRNA pseudouridine(55) synthase TruB [Pseudomonadota bacterium]
MLVNRSPKRDLHGVLLLDKPTGMTSNAALQRVKYLYNAKKAGHTGSLDPLATGLLPICFGQATKVSEYWLAGDKKYQCRIKLGITTDTLDADGEIQERRTVNVTDQSLESALSEFRGEILQTPPMYSALKRQGQPLYKLARQGIEVEREPRVMVVHKLSASLVDADTVDLSVHCSSGFYIRSLAQDLGQRLGCGAHVVSLRRTAKQYLEVTAAVSLDDLMRLDDPSRDERLLPIESMLRQLPSVQLTEGDSKKFKQGQGVRGLNLLKESDYRVRDSEQILIGLGKLTVSGEFKSTKQFVTS